MPDPISMHRRAPWRWMKSPAWRGRHRPEDRRPGLSERRLWPELQPGSGCGPETAWDMLQHSSGGPAAAADTV
jgi:hypothetical protein